MDSADLKYFLTRGLIPALFHLAVVIHAAAQKPNMPQNERVSLREYLETAEKKFNVDFFFRYEWVDSIRVAPFEPGDALQEVMTEISAHGLQSLPYSDWQFVLIWKENNPVHGRYEPSGNFNRVVDISGRVTTLDGGEGIPGATIMIVELDTGTVTDPSGNYRMNIPSGYYHIKANSVGLEEEGFLVALEMDTILNFELSDRIITLSEVIISEEGIDRNVNEIYSGRMKLDMLTIRGLPAFMGETDVVRSLLMMPGVSTVGEGASGFNVRGGAVDQNLVLIDHTPVFNSSHLFGLFSAFNQDLVKDVTLYKGAVPARFGGRLSSVLDVSTREDLPVKISGRGGIGLIANRLTLDIPLVKEKISVIAGGRGAFNNFLLNMVPDPQVSNSSAWFYDLNLKFNYNLDEKNILRASFYKSFDRFRLPGDTAYYWGTDNLSVQWNHLFGKDLVSNFTIASSRFTTGVNGEAENMGYDWKSGILYRSARADFNWLLTGKHQLGFGGSVIRYDFNTGDLLPDPGSTVNPVRLQDEQSYESALYVEDEFDLSERISLTAGIRFSSFQSVGPSTVNIYAENRPLSSATLTGTRDYSSGELVRSYSGWEPRFGGRIKINTKSAIKFSYNRMYQYIHLVSNSSAVSPVDTWYPSNLYILPEYADMFSAGYFRNFLENTIETSVEIFYRDIKNQLDYKDGARLMLNEFVEEELLQGDARAYGIEFLFRKKIGRLTGWAAYTLSRSERKMESRFDEETINFGNYYPAAYDHPHNLSITTTYRFTRRWSFSAAFVFMSGRPGTYPYSKYVVDHFTVAGYGERNINRIPDYHRLDISFTLEGNLKKNKKWDGSWTFSIYNLYNRNNAYSVFFRSDFGSIPKAYKLSVLGATFPALTYNFRF